MVMENIQVLWMDIFSIKLTLLAISLLLFPNHSVGILLFWRACIFIGTFRVDTICLCVCFIPLLFLVEGVNDIIHEEESLVEFDSNKKQWCTNLVIVHIAACHLNFNHS